MLSTICLPALVGAVSVAASVPALASAPPPRPPSVERWDGDLGWLELPSLPGETPGEVWTETFEEPVEAVAGDAGVVVVAERAEDGFVLTRVDPTDGVPLWQSELAADRRSELDLIVVDDGNVVLANVSHPDRGDPDRDLGAWTSTGVDAASGRTALFLDNGILLDAFTIGEVLIADASDGVHGVDLRTGTAHWALDDFRVASVDPERGTLVVEDGYGELRAVEPASGALVWTRDAERHTLSLGGAVLEVGQASGGDVTVHVVDPTTGESVGAATISGLERLQDAWMAGDDLLVVVGSPDATVVHPGRESTLSVGIDPVSGDEVWRRVGIQPRAMLRVDGTAYLLDLSLSETVVADAATGEVVATADISSQTGDVYPDGPYVYHNVDGELRAATVPDLAPAWQVDLGADSHLAGPENGLIRRYLIPVDDGFVAVDRDADDRVVLRGFLDG